jgi:hypothetical protein
MTISDEFSSLPISAQRRWQLRAIRDKRCVQCGKPVKTKWHCEFHAAQTSQNQLKNRKKNPLHARARGIVVGALRTGKLKRQLCEVEGCGKPGQAHHTDYEKPLEVTWLCHKHHVEAHGRLPINEGVKIISDIRKHYLDQRKGYEKKTRSV